jgi:hypothetical protein
MYFSSDTHKKFSQVTIVDGDGRLQDEIRLPNDRLDEFAEEYSGGDAAIEVLGNYRPI